MAAGHSEMNNHSGSPIAAFHDAKRLDVLFNRFPLKQGWDCLALGQIMTRKDLTARQKFNCLKFYFDPGPIDNLYATLTRSGSHWSILGMSIAMELAAGRSGEYSFIHNSWRLERGIRYLKFDWRVPTGELSQHPLSPAVNEPFLYHSHHPYYRIRSVRLKKMKVVVLLRSIYGSMESKFFKLGKIPDNPDIQDDRNFAWAKIIDDAIEFYNSWGDAVRWHPNCLVFRYEDLLADPVGTHKQMADFWNLGIPTECLEEAFAMVTKEEMKKRLDTENVTSQKRVSYRSSESAIPEVRRAQIQKRIKERLVYDFGYGFG